MFQLADYESENDYNRLLLNYLSDILCVTNRDLPHEFLSQKGISSESNFPPLRYYSTNGLLHFAEVISRNPLNPNSYYLLFLYSQLRGN